ncbi:hypothetical protein [uncultured Porphyromonas sp.]|uniref:hypothetical protein n=1 Tax=uncultured Porphyromonas sp. TaxID=159274 RepID=UPI002611BB8C|nr:hypothetical protein [uncultured Porphyromonas sp.]
MTKIQTLIVLLLLVGLSACHQPERPDVMSHVTLQLDYSAPSPVVRRSYKIEWENLNTRRTTTRNSVTTSTHTDELYRGLYDVRVEGTLLLESGETVWIRGSATERLFLDKEETCRIKMLRML